MKQRNYSIDLLKVIFALNIALGHMTLTTRLPLINIDYVVNLFFLLSGYFLVRSLDSGKYSSSWQYTMRRVCRIWPAYMLGFGVLFLYTHLSRGASLGSMLRDFSASLPEILLVQNIGIFPEGINFPTWQLSALIFASHILFSLLRRDRQLTVDVICPLLAVGGFACLGTNVNIWGTVGLFFYVPLIRAFAGLSLGIFLHDPICLLLKKLENSSFSAMPALVSAAAVGMLPLIWLNRHHATLLLLPFIGLLICLLYPGNLWGRLLSHPALGCLDRLSLGIYVNHVLFLRILENHPQIPEVLSGLPVDLVFLAVLILYSFATMKLVELLLILFHKARPKKNPV